MTARSFEQWLQWQESLHKHWIELGLGRIGAVAGRLRVTQPQGPVFTVAGTNGKGSTVTLLEHFLRDGGVHTGAYTSPHLVRYNERVCVAGEPASDAELIAAFERIEGARGATPLTFFEFGTLAAFLVFGERRCQAWVLEVGMGGRLDAVNIMDPDYAVITTVALDHEEFLGGSVEAIAAEKAGILRPGRPCFYGDRSVPEAVRRAADQRGAILRCLGEHFDYAPGTAHWSWRGARLRLSELPYPPAASPAQLRNISVALAALEEHDAALLADQARVNRIITSARPAGRFQVVEREHQWILDVAHNPQAAATFRAQLETLPPAPETTVVIGMLGDRKLAAFARELGGPRVRWVTCTVDDPRARRGESLATELRELGLAEVREAPSPADALATARATARPGSRIVVCGSFRMVGPALQVLGLY